MSRNLSSSNTALGSKIMRLQKIKKELEINRKLLENEKGYMEILGFINDYFEITAKMGKNRSATSQP